VSYINGYLHHDIRSITDLVHSNGGYVYTDVVQAAGAVPIDMRAMGIDFAACSSYKWLMGARGFGYLYVRDALQGDVMRRTQYGDRQFSDFEYHIFPYDPPGPRPATWQQQHGAGSFYEVGNISNVAGAGQLESLAYILRLGVDNIRAHARPLTAMLRQELPRLGYPCITPENNETPTVSFIVKDTVAARAKAKKANVTVKIGESIKWHHMRVSTSVYNTRGDVDKLLNALS
jgi:selenocysteine lyase/cysteine desulfurase